MNLIKALAQFGVASLRALAHPEEPREWRMAWAFFVFPLAIFVLGAAVSVAFAVLLPGWWNWALIPTWLFYIWIGEPYMYYVEGDAFERWMRWVEHGGE